MVYFNHFQNHFQTFSIQLFESTNLGERDRHLLSLVLMGGICFSPWRLGWGPKWSVAWNLIYMLKVVALNFTVQSHPWSLVWIPSICWLVHCPLALHSFTLFSLKTEFHFLPKHGMWWEATSRGRGVHCFGTSILSNPRKNENSSPSQLQFVNSTLQCEKTPKKRIRFYYFYDS